MMSSQVDKVIKAESLAFWCTKNEGSSSYGFYLASQLPWRIQCYYKRIYEKVKRHKMKLFLKAPENLVLKHDMIIYDKISKALGSNLDKSSFFIFVFAGLAWQHEQTRSQVCVCVGRIHLTHLIWIPIHSIKKLFNYIGKGPTNHTHNHTHTFP